MTLLCVPIFVTDLAKARRDMSRAIEAGADIVELRMDSAEDPHGILEQLLSQRTIPVIVTCRPTWEGGQSHWDDNDRLAVLAAHPLNHGDYFDVELGTADEPVKNPVDTLAGQILSHHDLTGRPQRLYNIVADMTRHSADVNKIVWNALTIRDNLEAFDLLQHRTRPTIALCMGEPGLISRILAKKFGAFLTFASLDATSGTAPGQITIEQMKNLYRWDAISPSTKVYGVVAHPVHHSMSPAIHNAAFSEINFDGVYLPLLVEPSYESFKAFMESFVNFPKLDLSGLSVTIPHKENALRYLRESGADVEELAATIGAVNTIAIDRTGEKPRLRGSNTDYAAILDCITNCLSIDRKGLSDLRVGIIGAGGAGRAAVAGLAHYGASIRVFDVDQARVSKLADEFNGKSGSVSASSLRDLQGSDVWFNASPVGMHPNVNQSPLGDWAPAWNSKTIVFDAVYNPIETRYLKSAKDRGANTITGLEMFVRQAVAQFETWTSKPAPAQVMRRVVEDRLKAH